NLTAGLGGEIRYNANVTVQISAPASETIARGQPLGFDVSATDVEPGPLTLTATGLPEGASFSDAGGGHGTFTWTPGIDQIGNYAVTFHVVNSRAVEDSVQTRIRVTGLTSLTLTSDPGDYLGNGQSFSYTPHNAGFSAVVNGSGG